jgi:cyclic beta-1,2-glucan synthetase
VSNPEHRCRGVASAELDGISVDARAIPLKDDDGVHEVTIVLGADSGLGTQSGATRRAKRVRTEESV